jgi:hypothetical protein
MLADQRTTRKGVSREVCHKALIADTMPHVWPKTGQAIKGCSIWRSKPKIVCKTLKTVSNQWFKADTYFGIPFGRDLKMKHLPPLPKRPWRPLFDFYQLLPIRGGGGGATGHGRGWRGGMHFIFVADDESSGSSSCSVASPVRLNPTARWCLMERARRRRPEVARPPTPHALRRCEWGPAWRVAARGRPTTLVLEPSLRKWSGRSRAGVMSHP